jgi:ribose 5-phosphate isomerase B
MDKIVLGADHGGYTLKELVKKHLATDFEVIDVGTFSSDPVDYPDIAKLVVAKILNGETKQGVLFCGTGIGISIAANRFPGIRAALCHDIETAVLSRQHNDANILVLGGRIISPRKANKIIDTWLATDFEGGRHKKKD